MEVLVRANRGRSLTLVLGVQQDSTRELVELATFAERLEPDMMIAMPPKVGNSLNDSLAVAFHRLLLPDGSWIDLEFTGLNQAGEGALQDEVDRHYFSTFAAAGAVGVVSGLALAGGSPFGLRAGVGQGLGQSATSVLDRFLNRLPTLTIRAGHRLRVWFTSDVLVPRAGTRQ